MVSISQSFWQNFLKADIISNCTKNNSPEEVEKINVKVQRNCAKTYKLNHHFHFNSTCKCFIWISKLFSTFGVVKNDFFWEDIWNSHTNNLDSFCPPVARTSGRFALKSLYILKPSCEVSGTRDISLLLRQLYRAFIWENGFTIKWKSKLTLQDHSFE